MLWYKVVRNQANLNRKDNTKSTEFVCTVPLTQEIKKFMYMQLSKFVIKSRYL